MEWSRAVNSSRKLATDATFDLVRLLLLFVTRLNLLVHPMAVQCRKWLPRNRLLFVDALRDIELCLVR